MEAEIRQEKYLNANPLRKTRYRKRGLHPSTGSTHRHDQRNIRGLMVERRRLVRDAEMIP